MATLAELRLTSEDARATLAELIASDQVTCSVEEAAAIWGVGRCTGYEVAERTFGAIRVGRKLRVSVPRLLRMLEIPLPEKWQPAGTLAERCQGCDTGSDSGELGTDHHARDAGRADVVALDTDYQRRHKGSGLRAQASPDRGRGGGRGSPDG